MKKITIFLILASHAATAQTLNQDAEGKSTLVYYGGNVGFDLSKTRLTFTYSNLSNLREGGKILWGVNAYGTNNSSVASVFSGGEIQPESGLSGLLGWQQRFDKVPDEITKYEEDKDRLNVERGLLLEEKRALSAGSPRLADIQKRLGDIKDEISGLNTLIASKQTGLKRRLLSVYAKWGQSAQAFKLAKPNPSTGFATIFEDDKFIGKTFSIGANFETGRWLLVYNGRAISPIT